MQPETSPEMLGRVSSSFMSVFSLAQVLGLLLSGRLAVRFDIRAIFLLCAAALAVIVIAGSIRRSRQASDYARGAASDESR